jgi:hypothetical protein
MRSAIRSKLDFQRDLKPAAASNQDTDRLQGAIEYPAVSHLSGFRAAQQIPLSFIAAELA